MRFKDWQREQWKLRPELSGLTSLRLTEILSIRNGDLNFHKQARDKALGSKR